MRANDAGIHPRTRRNSTTDLLDPWPAAGVLALYTIVFLAVDYWCFRTRDITSG